MEKIRIGCFLFLIVLSSLFKKVFHFHAEDFCNRVNFPIGRTAKLSFKLGIARRIHITAHDLNACDKILLLYATRFPQRFNVAPNHVGSPVFLFSYFHGELAFQSSFLELYPKKDLTKFQNGIIMVIIPKKKKDFFKRKQKASFGGAYERDYYKQKRADNDPKAYSRSIWMDSGKCADD